MRIEKENSEEIDLTNPKCDIEVFELYIYNIDLAHILFRDLFGYVYKSIRNHSEIGRDVKLIRIRGFVTGDGRLKFQEKVIGDEDIEWEISFKIRK